MKDKIFRNMSKRGAEMIKNDLDTMGPVRVSDVADVAIGHTIRQGAVTFLSVDLTFRVHMPVFGIDATLGDLLGRNLWFLALLCSVLPTPFLDNGDFDEASLRRVVDLFIHAGVNGVTAC